MATLQKNFPLQIGFMGVISSSEESSCNDDSCFGAMPALPELIAPKFTAFAFPSGSPDGVAETSGFETPKRKLQASSGEQRRVGSCLSAQSAEEIPLQRELASINKEWCSERIPTDDFILLDPSRLQDAASSIVFEGNQALEPSFRPIPQRPAFSGLSSETDAGGARRPMLDFDRRLQGYALERRNNFVPIGDDDDEDEFSTTRTSEETASAGGKAPTFKLKPRKSRRMEDYPFTW